MHPIAHFFKSFRTKVTLSFILSLFFAAGLGNFILYKYSLNSQFNQLKDKLTVIAQVSALAIDADELIKVPLNPAGLKSDSYKVIVDKLIKIKKANPVIKYIYTMAKTEKADILQFVVDPDAFLKTKDGRRLTAYPGDKYDALRSPQMLEAFDHPLADKKIGFDEWGRFLSGYAPVRDKNGKTIAILGVDMDANDVYLAERGLLKRGILVLGIGVILAFGLGIILSGRVTQPIKNLVVGTRYISRGDLSYRVKIKGDDEIAELAGSFNNMAKGLADTRKKLDDYFYRVVQSMVRSLEAKDHYTRGHSDRVSEYAQKIAAGLGFPHEKIELLGKAAQLHDIGKLGTHEDILNKNGPLSDSEWDMVRRHPAAGEEILNPVFLDPEMLSVIRSHHERFDGLGYPDGLKGDMINIFAQITSIADAYDAMTSSRSYRPALSKEEAIRRLRKDSGSQFNPRIVDAFIKILEKEK